MFQKYLNIYLECIRIFISLDFIIILIFGFYYLYRYSSFTISLPIFIILLFIYQFLNQNKYYLIKQIIFFAIITLIIISTLISNIALRKNNPLTPIHDNVPQIEAAIKALVKGQNPYAITYNDDLKVMPNIITGSGDILPNPAIYHVIALPGHLLFSLPFYVLIQGVANFYDQRLIYLLVYLISAIVLFSIPQKKEHKFLLTSLYAFNPFFFIFFITGRNDVLVLFFIIMGIFYLLKAKHKLAAVFLGFACVTKHYAVFIIPFLLSYYFFSQNNILKEKIKMIWHRIWPMLITISIVLLPFIFWNTHAFWDDVISYPAGTINTSYPIKGSGLSNLLLNLNLIKKSTDYFPFWIIQLPLCIITLFMIFNLQKKYNSLSMVIYGGAFLTLIYLFTSRFFLENYIGYIFQLFIIAYFLNQNSQAKSYDNQKVMSSKMIN